ncbi:MAG: transposase family protein [Bacteroidia bacterium]|nr:transposase family protein [Bacteroidia bacterium]
MQNRICYDTAVKHLYRKGLEAALPQGIQTQIPRSNILRWRCEVNEKYFGSELNDICSEKLELLQSFAKHKAAQRTFRAYLRLFLTFQQIVFQVAGVSERLRKAKSDIVNAVLKASNTLRPGKSIRIFRISRSTWQDWLVRVKHPCPESFEFLCLKRRPNQATTGEVVRIKALLTDPDLMQWPVCSVAWYALREGIVSLSLSTWYKYNRLLVIRRPLPCKRDRQIEGLRATQPNEYWHLDVTVFKTQIGVKHYIHILMDNFSRKILAWTVADKLSAQGSVEVLKKAWMALGEQLKEVIPSLIVDGGSENNAQLVESTLAEHPLPIRKLIAQGDILQSNSMVEAFNKTLKYRYLYRKHPANPTP